MALDFHHEEIESVHQVDPGFQVKVAEARLIILLKEVVTLRKEVATPQKEVASQMHVKVLQAEERHNRERVAMEQIILQPVKIVSENIESAKHMRTDIV